MSIRVMVAHTPQALADVYKLRYQVYSEAGHFKDATGGVVVDMFDNMPAVANIIAYDGDIPIATMRANYDCELGLPADKLFDFGPYREQAKLENQAAHFGSAGMLAIRQAWRNRRDVFRALLKMCCDVGHTWQVTHILSTVNATTATIYRKLGFKELAPPIWVPEVGEHIIPFGCDFTLMYAWAFGTFVDKSDFIDSFSGCFSCLLISANQTIFNQGDLGDEAYLISKGRVAVHQTDLKQLPDSCSGQALHLATLSRGDMFGELSLIDDLPRSATVTAVSNTELIVLDRAAFWQKVQQDSQYVMGLLKILTHRLRDIDQRAFIYAHGSAEERLTFFLKKIREGAVSSNKAPADHIAHVSVAAFATMASTSLPVAEEFLQRLQSQNQLSISKNNITFHGGHSL